MKNLYARTNEFFCSRIQVLKAAKFRPDYEILLSFKSPQTLSSNFPSSEYNSQFISHLPPPARDSQSCKQTTNKREKKKKSSRAATKKPRGWHWNSSRSGVAELGLASRELTRSLMASTVGRESIRPQVCLRHHALPSWISDLDRLYLCRRQPSCPSPSSHSLPLLPWTLNPTQFFTRNSTLSSLISLLFDIIISGV